MNNPDNEQAIMAHIREQIKQYPALLYMKGTPQFPQCGFSSRVVSILKNIGEQFAYVNVLQEPGVRQYLPQVSNWPTFPQLFINGELVGGCDIITELDEDGELVDLFKGIEWSEHADAKT